MAKTLREQPREESTVLGALRVLVRGGTLEHPRAGTSVMIGDQPVRIGRGESCEFRVDHRTVSAVHCELVSTELGVMLRDLGSKNGTVVGDVELGPDQYAYLRRETSIVLGDVALRFTPGPTRVRELARGFGELESRSPAMQRVIDSVKKLASIDVAVHITGETGTGKGFIARLIHDHGERASKPFIVIDCGAVQPSLAEAELFGYERGAFTDAVRRKESPFIEADGGTVFLDEVGNLPLDVQAKLLRAVEEQEVKSIGQNRYRKVNVRVLSATLHNLGERVNQRLFREDLYNRLCATQIALPPLRARREDIAPLTERILSELGRPDAFDAIPRATLDWMTQRDWDKGNVRQLRQVLKVAVGLAHGGPLDIEAALRLTPAGDAALVPADNSGSEVVYNVLTARGTSYAAFVNEASRVVFRRLVRETGGNLVEICRRAELSRPFLRDLLAKLELRTILPPRLPSAAAKRRQRAKK
jgi:DNA-binding NtrC family response regulator